MAELGEGFSGFKRLNDILYLRHLSWVLLDYGSIIQQLAVFTVLQFGKYTVYSLFDTAILCMWTATRTSFLSIRYHIITL